MTANNTVTPQPISPSGVVPRILVVEDNAVNQRMVQLILGKLGYHPDAAANGREALGLLECVTYDLILMDCQMPEMDGYETTRRIRRLEQGKRHTPIIAVTAGATQQDREKCLSAGMDDYLAKPIRLSDLRPFLHRYLALDECPSAEERSRNIEPPFPRSVLTDRIGEDPDQLRPFAELFQDETAHLLTDCRQAVQEGDGAALSRAAHALKGIFMSLEATEATAAARALERCAHAARGAEAAPWLARLETELTRITFYFTSLLPRLPADVWRP